MAKPSNEEVIKGNNKGLKIFLVIAVFVVLISIVALLLIVIQVPYTANVISTEQQAYTDNQCNNVDIKSVIEWGQNTQTCLNNICDSYQTVCDQQSWFGLGDCVSSHQVCTHNACTKFQTTCNLNIKNIDDAAGTWQIQGTSTNQNSNQQSYVKTVSIYVNPTETGTASWDIVYDAGDNVVCTYKGITNPTKQACNNVIKYKDVEKTNEVIRYCNAWKKLFGYC